VPAKTSVTPVTPDRATARERLLAAANELFYAEGVHTVGIDRIIEHAGVAKASLYNTFGSKDELIRAYLGQRHARTADRIMRALDKYETPREKLLGVFEAQADNFSDPAFRGCAFANASAEARAGSGAEQATSAYRAWVRGLFTDLARAAGAPDPEALGRQLHLLYDGGALAAKFDHNASGATFSHTAAQALIDAALGPA
jgi:AcrR family transcriptional regulator